MAYREPAGPKEEVLETLSISTTKGGGTLGFLIAMSLMFLVVLGVSVFAGAPPEIEPWIWTFPVGAVLFAIPAAWLWQKRKRTLQFVRAGEKRKLVVPGMVELTFPLALSGSQMTVHLRGVPMYHVYLKLRDEQGRAIFFQEIRGAIHGAQPGWFEKIDATPSMPAASFDVNAKGDIARIRSRVEEINDEL